MILAVILAALSALWLVAIAEPSWAQSETRVCIPSYSASGAMSCQDILPSFPFPVTTVVGAQITGNGAGTTGAVVGTLAAAAAKTTYICGFDVSAIGGTAAVGPITVAGLVGSSMVYQFSSSASGATLTVPFTPCIPASATNTAITITTTADGSASAVDVNAWGYQQ